MLFQRRPAEAADLLTALKAEQPNLVEARRLLGLALREQGDLAGAEFEFRDALAIERAAGSVRGPGGDAGGGPDAAAEAEEAYREALAIDPVFARAAIGLSELLLNENRNDEALAVIAPVGGRPDADIQALSAHAQALKALRRFDEAIAVYRRAAQVAPRSAIAEHNLAAVLADREDFAEAEEAVRRAFAKGLDASQTWLLLGRALQGLDRFDEAEQAYRQAISRVCRPIPTPMPIWPSWSGCAPRTLAAACDALDAAIAANPAKRRRWPPPRPSCSNTLATPTRPTASWPKPSPSTATIRRCMSRPRTWPPGPIRSGPWSTPSAPRRCRPTRWAP